MGNYIGIDLGTTFSSVATIDETGNPVIVKNDKMNESKTGNSTASCVALIGGNIVIGDTARRSIEDNPNAIGRFKRDMGTKKTYKLGDRDITPQDLSCVLLGRLREIAEKKLGKIEKAVVTVPANVDNNFRSSTMAAAKEAGLEIDHMINEPTAAALYYAYTNEIDNGKYAIFDLGGGTFDLSIIEVNGKDIHIITSNGIHKLGGDDFDVELVKLVNEKFKEEYKRDLTKHDYDKNNAEDDKISLSKKTKTIAGKEEVADEILFIKRKEFEDKINIMLSQIEMSCIATVEEANIKVEDINDVILVGGSCRIPIISEIVKKVFKKDPVLIDKLDEAVALGAALYAAYKSDGAGLSGMQKKAVEEISVGECSNHCFGASVRNPNTDQLVNDILIKKNDKIPCEVTKEFYTTHDDQTKVSCKVTQSVEATTNLEFVQIIWEGLIELPPGRPKGQALKFTYSYSDSEIMICKFKDVASGKEITKELSIADDSGVEEILIE